MLLYSIEENHMIEVISKSSLYIYKSNDIIYYQNSQPLNLFLILEGEVFFRKYSNFDLLAMIGGEENIIISKKYSKNLNSKMNKKNMLNLRNNAFNKGMEDINNRNKLVCGDFFGEENLMNCTSYENCAIANRKSIILEINIDIFNIYFKNKICKTKESIRELLFSRFSFFREIETKQFRIYMNNVFKMFPKNGEIICKENELSDKLYIIFQGKCVVQNNSKDLGNILFLNKGDLFGYESLINIPIGYKQNKKINFVKSEYTIVNKDDSTIILKFNIPFSDELTTWKMCYNLIDYFKEQKKIIKKLENFKNASSYMLQKEYKNLSIRKKRKIFLSSSSNNNDFKLDFPKRDYKMCYNSLALEKNNLYNKNINKRKVKLISQLINPLINSKIIQHSTGEMNKSNNKRNINNNVYSTPKKIKKNRDISTSFRHEKYILKNKKISSIINYPNKISDSKSYNLRRFSTNSLISTFYESKHLKKSKNKRCNMSNKNTKIIQHNKSKEYIKKNYFRNDNNICSKFDIHKFTIYDECMPFILTSKINIFPLNKSKSTTNKSRNGKINSYNYPFVSKETNSLFIF